MSFVFLAFNPIIKTCQGTWSVLQANNYSHASELSLPDSGRGSEAARLQSRLLSIVEYDNFSRVGNLARCLNIGNTVRFSTFSPHTGI